MVDHGRMSLQLWSLSRRSSTHIMKRREFIHEMYVGLRLNNFKVFSMNSKEMLSKALEKSICSMIPGRLCVLAC